MFKSLIIILGIVAIAALTSCGVRGELELPEGEKRETVI